ncbi:MAG: ABC transporter ATP-binding protein, partial [Fimbriimonadales bacterium]
DVGVYQSAVTIIRDSIDGPIKAVGALITILILQPVLAGIALLFMPLMVLVIQNNSKKMKAAQTKVQEDLADLNALTQEALQGTRVVKAFGAETTMESVYDGLVEASFASQVRAARRTAQLRPLVELIGAVAIAIVVFVSGLLASKGLLSVAGLSASIFALDVINQGLRNLASVSNTYAQVQAAAQRIYEEILEQPDEHLDSRGRKTIESPIGRLEFRNVSFAYPDGTRALRNVSFTLEPGTSLALVGQSGAGKSTIADLVLRFYDPTQGAILLDGIDLRDLKVEWLRSQFGVVPQQTFLFAGTIEENVKLGAPDACDQDVATALRMAHAEEFSAGMGERTSAILGERGLKLSGGQMQRVAIARALIRRPTLLILDEATSALDAESEKIVTEALQEVMKERTTLFIAHRLTTAARADRILHLRQGQVVEHGTHKQLMAAKGEYAALFRVFSSGLREEMQ